MSLVAVAYHPRPCRVARDLTVHSTSLSAQIFHPFPLFPSAKRSRSHVSDIEPDAIVWASGRLRNPIINKHLRPPPARASFGLASLRSPSPTCSASSGMQLTSEPGSIADHRTGHDTTASSLRSVSASSLCVPLPDRHVLWPPICGDGQGQSVVRSLMKRSSRR
jgi:hypothetical protein